MVSFVCEVCQETLKKQKLDMHKQRCWDAVFTCIDCSTTFNGEEYRKHTQCISEDEKYQKRLFNGNKKEPKQAKHQVNVTHNNQREAVAVVAKVKKENKSTEAGKDRSESKKEKVLKKERKEEKKRKRADEEQEKKAKRHRKEEKKAKNLRKEEKKAKKEKTNSVEAGR